MGLFCMRVSRDSAFSSFFFNSNTSTSSSCTRSFGRSLGRIPRSLVVLDTDEVSGGAVAVAGGAAG